MARIIIKRLLTIIMAVVYLMTPLYFSSVAAAAPVHNGAYVALGDSVAAGLGLPFSANPSINDIDCGLSPQAYPATLSRMINMPYVNAACNGATLNNLSSSEKFSNNVIRPQLDIAFSYGVPSLISITAGANDAHWDELITSCIISTCGSAAQTKLASSYMATVQTRMKSELQQINTRSSGNPPLTLVTGYYNPLSLNCSKVLPTITPAEVTWISGEVNALNKTIQSSTAGFKFVKYVPVTFQGHGLCDANPWVQTFANNAPIHPNLTGQNALAFVTYIARNQALAAGIK